MYVVVTVSKSHSYSGGLDMECYGPFKNKKEAQKYAKQIVYECLKFVEYVFEPD